MDGTGLNKHLLTLGSDPRASYELRPHLQVLLVGPCLRQPESLRIPVKPTSSITSDQIAQADEQSPHTGVNRGKAVWHIEFEGRVRGKL